MSLAVTRVALFGTLALGAVGLFPGLPGAPFTARVASLPSELITPPPGLGWVPEWALRSTAAIVANGSLAVFAAFAAVGFRYRYTGWLAAISAVWALGIPQFYGKIDHYHHVVWFALVLAASPADEALRWRAPLDRSSDRSSSRYGFPLHVIWMLIGVLYLSAGLQKIERVGLDWALSNNLRNRVWEKEFVRGLDAPNFSDEAFQLMALGALLFELTFVVLVVFRWTRVFAVAAGIAFHLANSAMLGVGFLMLLSSYVAFIPWRDRKELEDDGAPPRPAAVVVGVSLLCASVTFGLTATHSWPFAAYPSFAGVKSEETTTLAVQIDDSTLVPLRDAIPWLYDSRLEGLVRTVLEKGDPNEFAAVASVARQSARWLDSDAELRLVRVTYSVSESTRGEVLAVEPLVTCVSEPVATAPPKESCTSA